MLRSQLFTVEAKAMLGSCQTPDKGEQDDQLTASLAQGSLGSAERAPPPAVCVLLFLGKDKAPGFKENDKQIGGTHQVGRAGQGGQGRTRLMLLQWYDGGLGLVSLDASFSSNFMTAMLKAIGLLAPASSKWKWPCDAVDQMLRFTLMAQA